MIDRREVMLKAWEDYRAIRANYSDEEIARCGIDASFAASLRFAWKIVKQAAANVAREMAEAALLNGPNGPAIRRIKQAIQELQYKGFKHNIAAERAVLEERLAILSAANSNVFLA